MSHTTIGVFDSGLGGLTAVRRLIQLRPGDDIVFFGDTANVPYGTRDLETLVRFGRQNINFLLDHGAQYILAACGTISSLFPADEWHKVPVPCMGVLDAPVAAALKATRNGKIGVLATAATVRSGSFEQRLKAARPDVQVCAVACTDFVPLIEDGYTDGDALQQAARRYLAPVQQANADTIILGCTHYPLISPLLQRLVGGGVTLIDSAGETAARLAACLPAEQEERKGTVRYFVSGDEQSFCEHAAAFLGQNTSVHAERVTP